MHLGKQCNEKKNPKQGNTLQVVHRSVCKKGFYENDLWKE